MPNVPGKPPTTAVFYSISNCQEGLKGITFGNFLLKQVVEELAREKPSLKNFVTLSPVPQFAAWLESVAAEPAMRRGRRRGAGTDRAHAPHGLAGRRQRQPSMPRSRRR